jgi:hypothetical protein
MGKDLVKISQFIGLVIFIVQLIIAIKISKIKTVESPFNFFWIYPLVGSIIGLLYLTANFKLIKLTPINSINNASVLFHYLFISYTFFKGDSSQKMFKWILISLFIVIAIFIKMDISQNNTMVSFSIANGALFLYALYFIAKYLYSNTVNNLAKEPFFFLCTGVLIGTMFIVPSALMAKYLRDIKTSRDTIAYVACISSVGYIIINLFFIKALLVAQKNSLDIEQKENIVLNN